MDGLIEGRIVHFVLADGRSPGEHRPAIVVKVWRNTDNTPPANGCSNLQVFTDSNPEGKYNDELPPIMWATSILHDEDTKAPHSWHWPEIET